MRRFKPQISLPRECRVEQIEEREREHWLGAVSDAPSEPLGLGLDQKISTIKRHFPSAEVDLIQSSVLGEVTESWHWEVSTNNELLGKGALPWEAWEEAFDNLDKLID